LYKLPGTKIHAPKRAECVWKESEGKEREEEKEVSSALSQGCQKAQKERKKDAAVK
jgi:hypothetical protein